MWSMSGTDWSEANAYERAAAVKHAKREALREGLRRWGRTQRSQAEHRDPLVLGCLEAGITKEEIHILTGLGRTTIDRIEKGKGASR